MKKKYLTVGIVLTLSSSMMFTSCIGSFSLTNKVLSWNKQVGNKFVNTLIFAAFWPIPVYPLTIAADALVINSIEFWSGSNPVTADNIQIIDGKHSKYQIERNKNGYKIIDLANNTTVQFTFNSNENSWSLESDGKSYKLLEFVDENHVKMTAPDNQETVVELSEEGVLAYQELVFGQNFAFSK